MSNIDSFQLYMSYSCDNDEVNVGKSCQESVHLLGKDLAVAIATPSEVLQKRKRNRSKSYGENSTSFLP